MLAEEPVIELEAMKEILISMGKSWGPLSVTKKQPSVRYRPQISHELLLVTVRYPLGIHELGICIFIPYLVRTLNPQLFPEYFLRTKW